MDEPIIHVTFDTTGAVIILLGVLLFAAGLIFFTSWYWRRRLTHSSISVGDAAIVRKLDLLLDSLPDGVLLVDYTGRVFCYNTEARRLLSLDDVSLNDVSPRLDGNIALIAQRVITSRQTEFHELQPTIERKLQLRVLPMKTPESSRDGVVCLITDVSEQRQQETFYRHFIHNISHELLTPLAAVAGHVANAREASDEEAESRKISLTIIEREIKRLTNLTSNLLLLSRLEAETSLHPSWTNVGAVAEQAVTELLGLAQEKGIEVSIQNAARLPRLQVDRHRLKQVFINLVGNALKHCPAGTTVQVGLRTEQNNLVAEVKDNGPGISPEDLPHIFEKLYRVQKEGTRATEGSGLGLSIVKRIVELHGGEITAKSVVEQGTTFSIRLPLDQRSQL